MLRNKSQNNQLWAILNKLNLDKETLGDMVYKLTRGRTRSSKELESSECQSLITDLRRIQNQIPSAQTPPQPHVGPENTMRRKIISRCHEMQWRTDAGKVDLKRLNAWMLKYSYLHKPMNEYTYMELPMLVTQFNELLQDYYAKR